MYQRIAVLIVSAALIVAGVTACSKIADPEPVSTPTHVTIEDTPAPADDTITRDAAFRALMSSQFGSDAVDSAISVAESFCTLLDTLGGDYETAASVTLGLAQKNGVTVEQLGSIIGAGVPAYCPEYSDEAAAFQATYGD